MKLNDKLKESLLATMKNANTAKSNYSQQTLGTLKTQLSKVKERMSRLTDVYLDGSITQDVYNEKKLQYKVEEENLMTRLQNLNVADNRFEITLEYLVRLASEAGNIFERSRNEEKRKLISFVFSNLEIKGKNVGFSMRKPFASLPNLGNHTTWLCKTYSRLCPYKMSNLNNREITGIFFVFMMIFVRKTN